VHPRTHHKVREILTFYSGKHQDLCKDPALSSGKTKPLTRFTPK